MHVNYLGILLNATSDPGGLGWILKPLFLSSQGADASGLWLMLKAVKIFFFPFSEWGQSNGPFWIQEDLANILQEGRMWFGRREGLKGQTNWSV